MTLGVSFDDEVNQYSITLVATDNDDCARSPKRPFFGTRASTSDRSSKDSTSARKRVLQTDTRHR